MDVVFDYDSLQTMEKNPYFFYELLALNICDTVFEKT